VPRRVRNLGPYRDVDVVDIRGLYCYVSVEQSPRATAVKPLADGPWRQCGMLEAKVENTEHGRTLVLVQGDAARYRMGRIPRVHDVQPGSPFYQDLASPLKVTMFVRPGTKVLY